MPHVFISHVRNNKRIVQRLCNDLTKYGIKVWLDRRDIKLGTYWKKAIRKAIEEGAFFIACFSTQYSKRKKTYMNEELALAVGELRQRLGSDETWFIPILLSKCNIPDIDIGAGKTLRDIEYIELYRDWDTGIQHILAVIQPIPDEVQRLIEALHSDDDEVRVAAAVALGKTGHIRATPDLIQALSDENRQVRMEAAAALGSIGDPSAVPALIEALDDVTLDAALSLGEIGDARAVPALVRVLATFDKEGTDEPIVHALTDIGEPAIPHLMEALDSADNEIRNSAAILLGAIRNAVTVSKDETVRIKEALEALTVDAEYEKQE